MTRRQNFQTIAWFNDQHQRKRLNLNPPYQRRSVWNEAFKQAFVETILLGYPAPPIFLYEEIDDNGQATYNVVDGKQRLNTVFEYREGLFAGPSDSVVSAFRDKTWEQLDSELKRAFWAYSFSV